MTPASSSSTWLLAVTSRTWPCGDRPARRRRLDPAVGQGALPELDGGGARVGTGTTAERVAAVAHDRGVAGPGEQGSGPEGRRLRQHHGGRVEPFGRRQGGRVGEAATGQHQQRQLGGRVHPPAGGDGVVQDRGLPVPDERRHVGGAVERLEPVTGVDEGGEAFEPGRRVALPPTGRRAAVAGLHAVAAPHRGQLVHQGRVDDEADVRSVGGLQQPRQAAAGLDLLGQVVVGEHPATDLGGPGAEHDQRGHPQAARRPALEDGCERPGPADGHRVAVLQHVHADQVDAVGGGELQVGHVGGQAEVDGLPGLQVGVADLVQVLVHRGPPGPERHVGLRVQGLLQPLGGGDRRLVAPEDGLQPEEPFLRDVLDLAAQGDPAVPTRQVGRHGGQRDPHQGLGLGGVRGRDRRRPPRHREARQEGQQHADDLHARCLLTTSS